MRVLIGCEFSGVVRRAFASRGHFAVSVDLLPSEDNAPFGVNDYSIGWHYQGDLMDFIYGDSANLMDAGFDLAIFHPECTFLCNSGVRWLWEGGSKASGKINQERWNNLVKAADFYNKLGEAPIKHIARENPRMHKYAIEMVGGTADQFIQPWQYGHGEIKATGLKLKNLPKLRPTDIVHGREPKVHYAKPGPDRWMERSRTLPGIADAMADQWNLDAKW